MVRPIITNMLFMAMRSEEATREDEPVIQDLVDTLKANEERCVGLSANMIGVRKRILVASNGFYPMVLINPVIINKADPFEAEECCLSVQGVHKAIRYKRIEVNYLDERFNARQRVFDGFVAQIIQHEMDHFEGRLI